MVREDTVTKKKTYIPGNAFRSPINEDVAFLLSDTPEETIEEARERGLPFLNLPIEAVAPDPDQIRRLPHPSDLRRMAAAGDAAAIQLLKGLQELGASLEQHGQIQPVIVYPDRDPDNPAVTHRLLNGQRRWSAALLAGIPTLWAVEVERPSDTVRIIRQYEENEQREGFTDMERTWALTRLKQAFQSERGEDVPWGVVEEQLQLSTPRRQDLLRLLRFSSEAQEIIFRHGWSEWVLRSLHMAINASTIDQPGATEILRDLATREEVTAPIVTEVVEAYCQQMQARQTEQSEPQAEQPLEPALPTAAVRRITTIRRNVEQLRRQALAVTSSEARAELHTEVGNLITSLQSLAQELDTPTSD
jgi:ParB/RepB/Spo0J family partition protein